MAVVLLEGSFKLRFQNQVFRVELSLTPEKLTFVKSEANRFSSKNVEDEAEIPLNEIIGCKTIVNDTGKFFVVHSYARRGKKQKYHYKELNHYFKVNDVEIAETWVKKIKELLKSKRDPKRNLDLEGSKRKLLILVNPKSGLGRALEINEGVVKPILEKSEMPYEVIVTERSNHGKEVILNETDLLSHWAAIVIVSGDGLLYEVFQGLYERSDAERSASIPISIIPGGSGNGLAHSIIHVNDESHEEKEAVLSSALNLTAINNVRPMDLAKVTLPNENDRVIYSFLSVGWGIMADVDIESEPLRFLGEWRFTLWAALRTLTLRKYRGRLSYKKPKESEWITEESDFILVYCVHQPFISSDGIFAPEAKLDDGIMWLVIIRNGISRNQMKDFFLNIKYGTHIQVPGVEIIQVSSFNLDPLAEDPRFMTIDGEKITAQPIRVEILPSAVNIISKT